MIEDRLSGRSKSLKLVKIVTTLISGSSFRDEEPLFFPAAEGFGGHFEEVRRFTDRKARVVTQFGQGFGHGVLSLGNLDMSTYVQVNLL